MQAIILAGGFGTRLSAVVPHVPKPMAALSEEPFLATLLRYAYAQGVRHAVLALHHQADMIQDYFGNAFAGIAIRYSMEDKPLGTGGAIKKALAMMQQDKPVLVMNGDSLVVLNYDEMLKRHQQLSAAITLASMAMPTTHRYSKLTIEEGRIAHYAPLGDEAGGDISVGFYVLQPDIFAHYLLPDAFSFERDFLARFTPHLRPACYQDVEYFIDIGVPEDYARAQHEIPRILAAA